MAITVWSGVAFNDATRVMLQILDFYPRKSEIYITSSIRYEPDSYHSGQLVYGNSSTGAIDIGYLDTGGEALGRDVANWLYQNFSGETIELINKSQGVIFAVKNQVRTNPYSAGTIADHTNHVHWATSLALANGIRAKLSSSIPPPASKPPDDFTPEQAIDFEALCWRIEAITHDRDAVAAGPSRGELNKFTL